MTIKSWEHGRYSICESLLITVIIFDIVCSNFTSWKESNFYLLLVNIGNPALVI